MNNELKNFVAVNGLVLINTTSHDLNFRTPEGEDIVVPCDLDFKLDAKSVVEEVVDHFCRTKFVGTPEGEELINKIFDLADMEFNGLEPIIIGSIVAMNAYPGRVAGMVPCPGLERVAPDEQRMRTDMFNIA